MDLLELYLEELRNKKNLSELSIEAYQNQIEDYLLFLKQNGENMTEVKKNVFDEYFIELEKKYKKTSLRKKYSIIRGFYKFLFKNRYVNDIFSYDFIENKLEEEITVSSNNSEASSIFEKKEISYEEFLNQLSENLNELRIKLICRLVIECNINLTNIFEIQINDLLKYDFKKVIIRKNRKIISYDLEKEFEELLSSYYKKYAIEKRFLFGAYSKASFNNDMKKYNVNLRRLKKSLEEKDNDIQAKIRELYFNIGIGDKK